MTTGGIPARAAARSRLTLGVDIGGTKVIAGVVDADGLFETTIEAPERPGEHLLFAICGGMPEEVEPEQRVPQPSLSTRSPFFFVSGLFPQPAPLHRTGNPLPDLRQLIMSMLTLKAMAWHPCISSPV